MGLVSANYSSMIYSSSTSHRSDIDGLRAFAVVLVVIFHSFPDWLPSGFIGVDIFFVISGYLISTIIFNELKRNNFSIIQFYTRRVNRIFPAQLIVLISCMIYGWFFLLQSEYLELGKHLAGGAGFVSNLVLWGEAGYFDVKAETKPLLHLWSLGIEEQFYFIWPLLAFMIWRFSTRRIFMISLIFSLSFLLNLFLVKNSGTSAFYLPFPRFWELLGGSILACLSVFNTDRPKWFSKSRSRIDITFLSNFVSALGFILIIIALFITNKERDFPGWLAVLPVMGTCFILWSGETSFLNKNVLSWTPFVLWEL